MKAIKTSQEWYDEIPKELRFVIYDPDGWDRTNYQYSFHEEKITKQEFMKRMASSTCLMGREVHDFFLIWEKQ